MRKYLQLVFLAVSVFCSEILLAESRDPVRILDLRTLNELDLKEQEKASNYGTLCIRQLPCKAL